MTVDSSGKSPTPAADGDPSSVEELRTRLSRLQASAAAERAQLQASLEEKELLLREVHHRVKNNLQVIVSLLSLQQRYAKDPAARAAFDDMLNRVSAMALVHEELNLGSGSHEVDFTRYTHRLANSLMLIHAEGGISHHFILEAERVWVDPDLAMTLGLLLNEAVSNAFKHAFPPGTAGEIRVAMQRDADGALRMTVSDNGDGFPEGFDPEATQTLGVSLMRSLVQQLGGTLSLSNLGGARLELWLPPREVGAAS